MLYEKYLRELKECPFCKLDKIGLVRQNKFAILTLAQAPYTKDHLLVIPKRHVKKLNNLDKEEKDGVEKLIYYGMKVLHKKHKNVTVLYKEGSNKDVGKSIDHLHYHLIPDMQIGKHDINFKKRKIMDEEEYISVVKRFRGRLS